MNIRRESLSVIIAVTIAVVIIVLLVTNIIRFSDISSAIAYVLVAGLIGVLTWGFRYKIIHKSESKMSEKMSRRPKEKVPSVTEETVRDREKIRNTVQIRVEDAHVYDYELQRGDLINGKIRANGLFNVFLLTPSSYRSYENGYGFNHIDGIEDAKYFEPQIEIHKKGKYHLVIENADRKNIEVDIELYLN